MGFLVNVDINNYFMYMQPSKLASGGDVIYVNENLNHSRVEACVLPLMNLRFYGLR